MINKYPPTLRCLLLVIVLSFVALQCTKMHMNSGVTARLVTTSDFSVPLPVPATLMGPQLAMDAHTGAADIGGADVSALAYGSSNILGPTIKIQEGEQFNLAFTNNLSEPTNIHWHGLEAPADQDGYPTDLTPAGGSFAYQFVVNNRPGTYWYHPHPDMATASQVYRGLAGFFIVSSPEEQALGLPSGEYDIPLAVQDKRLDGGLTYTPDADDKTVGFFGERVLVNGVTGPVLEVATRTYRFRLLNGSNARIYNFALSTGARFWLIGTDGGLLDAPQELNAVLLAPGERADILVDFSEVALGQSLFLQSNTFTGTDTQGKQSFNILKFIVNRQEADPFVLPASLLPVEHIPVSSAVATRSFNIGHMMHHGGGAEAVMHPLDGKIFDADRRDEVVIAGSTEIWEFDNTTGTETHPMHLHATQFQVIERFGGRGAIQAWEKGWKDTVLAFPGEKIRVIIRFPDNRGKFVFHCHNLEHEDGGMMLNFEIQ